MTDPVQYSADLQVMIQVLRNLGSDDNKKRRILPLWLGAPKQHFVFGTSRDADGGYDFSKLKQFQGCGPTVKVPFSHPLYDKRGKTVVDTLRAGNISVRWMNMTEYEFECERVGEESKSSFTVHMLPFFGWTGSFYRNHPHYTNTSSARDCTHTCWAPNLVEPLWDTLYIALNTRYCEKPSAGQRRYPSGNWSSHFIKESQGQQRRIKLSSALPEHAVLRRIIYSLTELIRGGKKTDAP